MRAMIMSGAGMQVTRAAPVVNQRLVSLSSWG